MRLWRVAGVMALIGAEALLYGYSYPFFSLALEKRELANWLIGLNASLAGAGILIVGPFLPRLIARSGLPTLVGFLFAASALAFAAILAADTLAVWFLARLAMGTCFAALWTTTEIWLNGSVGDSHRGRVVGASSTLYAVAQFIGPVMLGATGVEGPLPLVAAIMPLALGAVLALAVPPPDAAAEEEAHGGGAAALPTALSLAGTVVLTAFLSGIGETAMQSLLPLYGLAHGYDDAGAARLVAVFSLGEAALVLVIGWLADRFGRTGTLRLCALVAAATTLALPLAAGEEALVLPVLFLAGGAIPGLYALGVILLGQDFRGQRLAVVSTGFAMAYSAGSIVGSTPVGLAIDLFGAEALPLSIAACFLALSVFLFLRRPRPAEEGGG